MKFAAAARRGSNFLRNLSKAEARDGPVGEWGASVSELRDMRTAWTYMEQLFISSNAEHMHSVAICIYEL